ncbi:glycosyltransferase family 4 protein [Candidatus Falkowbacteria bacterium]|nr:glycosyltransferase family 4 protein [Candidatus Falkowbacteria bacterium]
MKILEINKFFYKKGGSELYLFSIRNLLKRHGHAVMDFSMNHEKNEPSYYQPYFIHPVRMDGKMKLRDKIHSFFHLLYSVETQEKLEQLIQERGVPDVAHIHNFAYHLTPSILYVLKKHNIPVVWTLHDYKVISPNYNLYAHGEIDECTKPDKFFAVVKNKSIKNSYLKSFIAAFEQWLHVKVTKLYGAVDAYVAPSKFLANKVIEYGIDANKVHQIYNTIDISKYKAECLEGEYYIYVGRFIKEKGVMRLLEAFKELPQQKLIFIGAGDQEIEMKKFIADNEMRNVEILPPIYGAAVYEYIKKAKALMLTSEWYENNPLVILDAFALGVPVIGTRIGGITELIEDGVNGLLCEPFDAHSIAQAVKRMETLDHCELGRRARAFVESIADEEVHYEKIMKVFEEVISEKKITNSKN